jgi:osmoprotectant transport system permease protein
MAAAAPEAPLATEAEEETRKASRLEIVGRLLRYIGTPVVLAAALGALYAYVANTTLDPTATRSLNLHYILTHAEEHIVMSVVVTAIVLAIAVPLGVVLTRPGAKSIRPPVLGVANVGQAVPSIGVVILLYLVLLRHVGLFWIAVISFAVYGILPVLRNTMVGLQQVNPSIVEAARGVGMSKWATLIKIDMPLAVPVILAGIRTTLVISVGTVAFAAFIGAGGLGQVISNGIAGNEKLVTYTGAIVVAVLALAIDWVASIAEDLLSPKGLS